MESDLLFEILREYVKELIVEITVIDESDGSYKLRN